MASINQTQKPMVSIVIPVYNGSKYLKQAIDSALSQTYQNIEVLVINDGSKDNNKTHKVCLSYGNKIRYFKKENGGVATALNLGIQKMKGEYFSWLSHDDVYQPYKIEFQIHFLEESSIDMTNTILYSSYSLISKSNQILGHNGLDGHKRLLQLKPNYGLYWGCIYGCTVLIHQSVLKKVGLFNINLKHTQDYNYWMRCLVHNIRFHFQDIVLVQCRLHRQQNSRLKAVKTEKDNEVIKLWLFILEKTNKKNIDCLSVTPTKFYNELYNFFKSYLNYPQLLHRVECKMHKEREKKNTIRNKVSIIIPFYNRDKQVIKALESIKKQTYTNYEIILVNDGSTQTFKTLKEYCNHHHIKIYNIKVNKGPAHARNIAMKYAKGTYFCFLDSDDLFFPEKLKVQLDMMKEKGYLISCTSYIKCMNNQLTHMITNDTTISSLIYSCEIALPTVMLHRSIYDKDYRFPENIEIGEDICFWLLVAKRYDILNISQPLTQINCNIDSAAYNLTKLHQGLNNILEWILKDNDLKQFHEEILRLQSLIIETKQFGVVKKKYHYLYKIINSNILYISTILEQILKIIAMMKYRLIYFFRK